MIREKAHQVGENLLVAIGYGDSTGLPVETKSRSVIKDTYGEIRKLHNISNPFFGEAEAGTWSDDTQLSLAVAEALIGAHGFTMESQVESHIKAMDDTPQLTFRGKGLPRGWGKSSWESVERLKLDRHSWAGSGNPKGEGNGVLMKLAPLALWQTLQKSPDDNEHIEKLALMTHANDLSVVTALVHRDILRGLFEGRYQPDDVVGAAVELAFEYEKEYANAKNKTSVLLGRLGGLATLTAENILDIASGGGFQSSETLVMAYGAFSRQPEYPESVYEAVNYGGDADSVGSIVAAMSTMHASELTQPHDIDSLQDLAQLRRVGMALVSVAMNS